MRIIISRIVFAFVFIAGMMVDAAPPCVDDPKLKFKVGNKKRNCKWVSKKTKSRCKKREKKGLKLKLKELCPATCDHCPTKPPTDTPVSPTDALCELSEEKENVYIPDTIEQFSSLQDAKIACDSDMNCDGVTLYNNKYETRQGGALLQSNASASSWVCETACELSKEKKNLYLLELIEQFSSLQDAKNACDSDMNCGGVTLYNNKYETRQGGALVQSNAGASSWVCERSRLSSPSPPMPPSPPSPTPSPVTDQPPSSTLCEFSEEKKDVYLPATIEQFPSLQDAKNACDSDMNCGGVTLYNNKYETRQGGALVQSNAGASSWVCERSRPPRPQARPGQGPDVPDSETCWSRTRDITTVAPEEWEYFLLFQESRRKGFSSPCGDAWTGNPTCNDPAAGKNHWPPNPVKVVFDCKMWVAAYRHAEDQAIQGYFSHFGENPRTSERERSERVGAQSRGEHQAGRDSSAAGALNGLQGSPGHSNSMMQPKYKGMAVAHGKPGQRGLWTVLYNFGGDMIVDSESCIPEGYTATGDLK